MQSARSAALKEARKCFRALRAEPTEQRLERLAAFGKAVNTHDPRGGKKRRQVWEVTMRGDGPTLVITPTKL